MTMWGRTKFAAPILRWFPKKGLTAICEAVTTDPMSKHILELQEKMKRIIQGQSLLSLSFHDISFLSV